MQKRMRVLKNILLIIIAVPMLFLMCMPLHEARETPNGRNQDMLSNYKNKLVGAVQQGEAPPYVPNPSSIMNQKALYVTDHTIDDVSPSLRRMLKMGPVPPSESNPSTWNHKKQKSRPSSP